jgi:Lysosomal transcription factor, NCU-G1
VRVFGSSGNSAELPHLPYSANISLINVSFSNLQVHREKSRLAVEIVMVTSDNVGNDMSINKKNSFDDSLTPGSFEVR